jgi:hypothetical protein
MLICFVCLIYFNFVKMKYLKQGKQVNLKTGAIYYSMGNTIPESLKRLSRAAWIQRGCRRCLLCHAPGHRWQRAVGLAKACLAWPRASQTRMGPEA